jgi:hypothetical protein
MMHFADFIAPFDAETIRTQYYGQRPVHIRDFLYLPRGQYHDALTGSQASLHVTFGVAPATGAWPCSSFWRVR